MDSNSTVFDPKITAQKAVTSTLSWYHFSVDDVFDSLIEVTDRNIPLFEHPTFRFYKDMHDTYGLQVGLNLFFQKQIDGEMRSLREVRDLKAELEQEGNWLKFGPHALDFDTAPYDQSPDEQKRVFDLIYQEIDRFAGRENRERWVRLHYYSESYELGSYFKDHGVEALFSTDRPAGSHRMPDHVKIALTTSGHATYEGTNFIRTQFRMEFLEDRHVSKKEMEELFEKTLQEYGYIVIYTHEYELSRPEILEKAKLAFDVLAKKGVLSITSG